MAKAAASAARVGPTDAELDEAIAKAAATEDDRPRVDRVEFSEPVRALVLHHPGGDRSIIPLEKIEGLNAATASQLNHFELLGGGTAVDWPDLKVTFSVAGLMRGVYGTAKWMSQIGQLGGKSRSDKKAEAVRENGKKGGRPKSSPGANYLVDSDAKIADGRVAATYVGSSPAPRARNNSSILNDFPLRGKRANTSRKSKKRKSA